MSVLESHDRSHLFFSTTTTAQTGPPPRPRLSWSDALKEGDIIEVTRILDESVTTNTDLVNRFLELDRDVGQSQCTPLTVVCSYGHVEIAQLLLTWGADSERRNGKWITAAIAAAIFGHTECLRLLLDNGANIDPKNGSSKEATALFAAVSHGRTDCARLLLDRGAKIDEGNARGYTPLISASGTTESPGLCETPSRKRSEDRRDNAPWGHCGNGGSI